MLTRRRVLHGIGSIGVATAALRATSASATSPFAKTPVAFDVPRGSCDCHVHVFDPERFPFVPRRVYTPPAATVEQLTDLHQTLRIDRVVIVQPSVYGADNACTLDGVRRLGKRARAVIVIDKATTSAQLDDMAAAGVSGIRLNLNTTPSGTLDADASKRTLDQAAEQIKDRGWHIQFYTQPAIIAALKSHVEQLPFPVVFDHFGAAQAAKGPAQPGFDALLDLVKSGRAYVKISAAYRTSEQAPDYADATPLAQALIAANPDRIVWGTDWPHPDSAFGRKHGFDKIAPPFAIDNGIALNNLPKWTADPAIRKRILVDNPARLYGFEAA